jgi:hypothetical protein
MVERCMLTAELIYVVHVKVYHNWISKGYALQKQQDPLPADYK